MRISPVRTAIVAALALAFTGSTRADTITAQFLDVNPGGVITFTLGGPPAAQTLSGFFNFNRISGSNVLGESFSSFCMELTQGIAPGTTATFSIDPLSSQLSATQVSRMQELWGRNRANVVDATSANAFQMAVWEIVHETAGNPLDLSAGNFIVTDGAGASALSQSWLSGLDGTGPFETNLVALTNPDVQDQVAILVPVPPAAILAGIGLISLTGYGIRRRRRPV